MGQFSLYLGVHSLFVSRISREQKRNKEINLISKKNQLKGKKIQKDQNIQTAGNLVVL